MTLGSLAYVAFATLVLRLTDGYSDMLRHLWAMIGSLLCVGAGAVASELFGIRRSGNRAYAQVGASYRLHELSVGAMAACSVHGFAAVVML